MLTLKCVYVDFKVARVNFEGIRTFTFVYSHVDFGMHAC